MPLRSSINDVMASAFRFAAATASSHLGVGHLLVAVLADEATVASRILRELGVSRERVSELFQFGAGADSGSSQRVVVTPSIYGILGMARGIAVQQGASEANPSHLLLAMVYSDSALMASSWERLGVTGAEIVERLAYAGVAVPAGPPLVPKIPRPTNGIIFPEADLRRVLDAMLRRYPPGSDVQWGWNKTEDGRCVIYTDKVSAVQRLVESTVEDASNVSLLHRPPDDTTSSPHAAP